jgi:membrane protease YdiL (CAAX protease family)
MSIEHAAYLASITVAATTSAATQALTPTAASGDLPLVEYMRAIATATLMLTAGIAIFWATYGRKKLAWSPPRVLRGASSAGVLWVGGAVMVWLFLAVPMLLSVSTHESATTRAIGADGTNVLLGSSTYLSGLAIVALLHIAWRRSGSARMLGLTPFGKTLAPGRAIVAAVISLPLTYVVATASMLVWQWVHFEHESAHAMLQLMERNETSPWVLWLTILNATLLAPLYEEVLFRGHLQTALTAALQRSRWPAIVIASALFAMMHDGWTMPAMFALSLAIGVAYEWSGSLWVAIAIHVAFNATSTVSFLSSQR